MNKDVAKRWVEALRSGEYKQARRALADELPSGDIGYCCLGVLCELAVADGVIPPKARAVYPTSRFSFNEDAYMPPDAVDEWAGQGIRNQDRYRIEIPDEIADRLSEVGIDHGNIAFLPELNDDAELTFSEIADLIEKNFLNDAEEN